MGIRKPELLTHRFLHGVYKRNPKSYNIYVDGEFCRFKGMLVENTTAQNSEELIAQSSFDYVLRTINYVRLWIGRRPQNVIVYMDGKRVYNKTTDRTYSDHDVALIRHLFMQYCKSSKYTVINLRCVGDGFGESELRMYLERDRNIDLNIMLTQDSDMLAICFDHEPKFVSTVQPGIAATNGQSMSYREAVLRNIAPSPSSKSRNHSFEVPGESRLEEDEYEETHVHSVIDYDRIVDLNDTYDKERLIKNKLDVIDSCVWLLCSKGGAPLRAIGFDGCSERLRISGRAFRVYTFMCGNDFNGDYLLTPKMFPGLFDSIQSKRERDILNSSDDFKSIVALILLLGLRGGGTPRKLGHSVSEPSGSYAMTRRRCSSVLPKDYFKPESMVANINRYCKYITTGIMHSEPFFRFNAPLFVRHFVYAMRKASSYVFTKNELMLWANEISFATALENLKLYLGRYDYKKELLAKQSPKLKNESKISKKLKTSSSKSKRIKGLHISKCELRNAPIHDSEGNNTQSTSYISEYKLRVGFTSDNEDCDTQCRPRPSAGEFTQALISDCGEDSSGSTAPLFNHTHTRASFKTDHQTPTSLTVCENVSHKTISSIECKMTEPLKSENNLSSRITEGESVSCGKLPLGSKVKTEMNESNIASSKMVEEGFQSDYGESCKSNVKNNCNSDDKTLQLNPTWVDIGYEEY